MYYDLFLPFPLAEPDEDPSKKQKKKDKGKGKAPADTTTTPAARKAVKSCWEGLSRHEREVFGANFALSGHLGYSVVGLTVPSDPSSLPLPSPFQSSLPFPHLDPRHRHASSSSSSASASSTQPTLVQAKRFHMRLDDSRKHCFTSSNTHALQAYDLLSVQPLSEKALQLACTDLANPGPNQISIITLPLHEKPYHFRLNRKQIRQAQRNGVVLEILYAAALFPPPSTPPDVARRYRQNWMSNAKEIVRITNGGKGVIFSSGLGGGSMRGCLDVVNLATVLGMPANLAKDAISANPKAVLLKAQARHTFKAILSTPCIMPPPASAPTSDLKRSATETDTDGQIPKRTKAS